MRKFKDTFEKPSDTPGVYGILNIVTGAIYVGSSVQMRKRWQVHRRQLARGEHDNTPMQRSWVKHGEENFVFYVVARGIPEEILWDLETDFIPACPEERYNLMLTATAGRGPRLSSETRAKISASNRGRKLVPLSAEHRAKISAANRGKLRSPEQRARISAARRGKPLSPQTRAKISAAAQGKSHSPEHREKIAAAARGRPWSPARRAAFEAKKALAD